MARTKDAGFRVVTVANQKGGCGKTTLSTHLAVEGSLRGHKVLLVDLDPQGSAAKWWKRRQSNVPLLVAITATQLADTLATAREEGYEWTVIDTPPHAAAEIRIAVAAADHVLVPTRPTIMDLDALPETADIVRAYARPAGIVLSAAPARSGFVAEVRAKLATDYPDMPVLKQEIGNRTAYHYAMVKGQAVGEYDPQSKAATEMAALFRWCHTHIKPRTA